MESTQSKPSNCGIGLTMDQRQPGLEFLIASIKPGGGAERAGLLRGSIVHAVNGRRIQGVAMNQVRAMIVGPEDSQVTMTVELPGGGDVRDVPCFRIRMPPEDGSGKQATLSADLIAGLSAGNVQQDQDTDRVRTWLKSSIESTPAPQSAQPAVGHQGIKGLQGRKLSVGSVVSSEGMSEERLKSFIEMRVKDVFTSSMLELSREENSRLSMANQGLTELSSTVSDTLTTFKEHLQAIEDNRVVHRELQSQILELSEQMDGLLALQVSHNKRADAGSGNTDMASDIL